MRESADLAYKNHPVKFTVYIHNIDVTHDIDSYGNIEASLDYPQISEFRIGEANFVLRDYDAVGNVGQKYNPEYANNFFSQYGLQSGYKSPVRIEIHFLVDEEEKSSNDSETGSNPIILFEGRILSLNKGLKTGTVEITCSDLTQEFRTQNTDNFGIQKQIALAKSELSDQPGEYQIADLLAPVSEESLIPVFPDQLEEVDRLKTTGVLDKYNFVVTDRGIQLEDGFLEEDVTLSAGEEGVEEGVDKQRVVRDVNPIIFFKAPYRNKRIEDLVKKIVAHYGIGNAEIEIPQPKLDNHFFSNMGRVGYDFDKKDSKEKWRWEGYVTDFIYGQNLANLNTEPFNHSRSEHDQLTNPLGLADGANHFYTIQSNSEGDNEGLGRGSYLYSIDIVTGRTASVFEFENNQWNANYTPLADGMIFYENKLLILAFRPGRGADLFVVNPFHLNYVKRLDVNPITLTDYPNGIQSGIDNSGLVKSLVHHDEKLYLIKENGLWRIDVDLDDDIRRASLTKVGEDFNEDYNEGPRLICAVSYDSNLYGIGQRPNESPKLYKINHYTAQITEIKVELPPHYVRSRPDLLDGIRALSTYQGILYALFDEQKIDEVTIKRNPYEFSSKNIYENSGGDKLFFLYSSDRLTTIPKIIEYDIETDTYTELYSHVRSQNKPNEVSMHAEFWKITSIDHRYFYILGTEPHVASTEDYAGTEPFPGNTNKYFGTYNSSDANYASPSRIKIWIFDRITLDFRVYIDHATKDLERPNLKTGALPIGIAPPQLGHYYHGFEVKPDSRKNFQVIKRSETTFPELFYIWANGISFGIARAKSDPRNEIDRPEIKRVFVANIDNYYNNCGCDFIIDEAENKIYGAFTFVNEKHKYSTFNIYSMPLSF